MAEATHLLGLPLKHKMKDISDLADELAKYLLLDGSRAMTGQLTLHEDGIRFTHPTYTPNLVMKIVYYENVRLCHPDYPGYKYDFQVRNIRPEALVPSGSPFDFSPYAGGIMRFVYQGTVAAEYFGAYHQFSIPRAGDITLLDDKFLRIGKDSDGTLPAADSSHRGKTIRIEGATGVADKVCVCVKKADDTYGWFDLISGTFVA